MFIRTECSPVPPELSILVKIQGPNRYHAELVTREGPGGGKRRGQSIGHPGPQGEGKKFYSGEKEMSVVKGECLLN